MVIKSLFGNSPLNLTVEFHNHLLPGVDDGVKNIDDSIRILREFAHMGYEKIILTPHIYQEFYPNSEEFLINEFNAFQQEVEKEVDLELSLGAEYFLDETLMSKLKEKKVLLTIHDNKLLVETSFVVKPFNLDQILFELQVYGYQPILAHPERYEYLMEDPQLLHKLHNAGVHFQVNAGSILGRYGSRQKKLAKYILKNELVDYLGSDIHRYKDLEWLKKSLKKKSFVRQGKDIIKNNTLN
jgi:tyrosine-protein phosphatase YwqE